MTSPGVRSVLLVEDSETDEKLTVRAFKKSGLENELLIVRDGAETLEFLFGTGKYEGRDTSDLPALILLDLNLPRVDGLEVLRRIRADERTRFVPVIILTASKEAEDRLRGYQLGANAYVRKPVSFSEFAEAIKTLGTFWLVLNEGAPNQRRDV
jgi:two-component system response regulator